MPAGLGTLRVLSINVNGLQSSAAKRKAFFQYLRRVQADVVVVQETHCSSDDQATQWVQQGGGPGSVWHGPAFWQHYNSSSRGVAILLKAGIVPTNQQPQVEYMDATENEPGRLLRVGWDLPDNQHLSVLAVYAPCEAASRPAFFAGPFADAVLLPQCQHSHLIVAGDFNCVLEQRDVQPAPGQAASTSARLHGAQDLQLVCQAADLQDAWRSLHPQQRDCTHHVAGQHTSGGRIDAVWVSQDLLASGCVTRADHLHDAPVGDHAAVLVQLQQHDIPPLGARRWIFPQELLGSDTAVVHLKERIQQFKQSFQDPPAPGEAMQRWEALKHQVQVHCQAEMRMLRRQQKAARRKLVQQLHTARRVQRIIPAPHTTAGLLAAKRALQLHEQHQAAERAACQEVVHEVYGESSTYYFHRQGRPPMESQLITEITNPAQPGATINLCAAGGTQQAAAVFADYYDAATAGLFAVQPTSAADQQLLLAAVDKQLTQDECQQCLGAQPDGRMELEEALAALQSLPRGKAPGSDGLTYEFYAAMWDEVGDWLVDAFNSAYLAASQQMPQLSDSQRLGLITLVHKGGGQPRTDPNSYRPITLLNCDVKIAAKVQVLRLGRVLPSVIDSTQTAFVPGRQIADNVLCHLEEVDYLQQTQQPGVALFLDFAKAYDRVDRPWLQLCMQQMGFPAGSIRWMRLLLQGTQAKIMFNRGQMSRVIAVEAGCAQGSPLSPVLYVIAAQPLAARCRQLQVSAAFNSIGLPGGRPAPCCHQHADDTTLHAADVTSAHMLLQQAVEPFCRASGGKLNISKSTAMVMGSHPLITGVEPTTGITFVDSAVQPVRHLGVLLSTKGGDHFADRVYSQRLQLIAWRVKHWSKHNLSLQGRQEVAKQVLASCLSYHEQFVQPPAAVMQRIVRVISAFILGRGILAEEDTQPLRGCPSRAIAALPKQQGGMAQVDVRAHCLALQAKVGAMLLHPRTAAWKQFMAASLQRAMPDTGILALIQAKGAQVQVALRAGHLNARHAGYIAAFQQVGLHRRVQHQAMTKQQILLEPLVGNYSVGTAADGQPFLSGSALPAALCGPANTPRPKQVRDVVDALQLQPATDGLVLPQQWHAILDAPAVSTWQCDQTGAWVKGSGAAYKVREDGSLLQVNALPDASATWQWLDSCVVNTAPGQQTQTAAAAAPITPTLFLVGAWSQVAIDPSVWGFGLGMAVLQYTVKAATERLLQFQCCQLPGWVPGRGLRPRLLRSAEGQPSATALTDMEAGQKRSWQDMMAAPGSSRPATVPDTELMELYEANWMRQSPARLLPRQRVQQAAAVAAAITVQRQQQQLLITQPAYNDLADPLTGSDGPVGQVPMDFRAIWAQVWDKQRPRQLRFFAWRLWHAALPVGAKRTKFVKAGNVQQLLQQCCQHTACQAQQPRPPLETLSHVFAQCPVAVGAWQWLQAVWLQVDPAAGPFPLDQQLVLLDEGPWRPTLECRSLWDYMRVLMLHSIWAARCSAAADSGSHTAQAVVGRFVAALRRQVEMDWQRVQSDIRWGTGMPFSWFRGRDPRITPEAFKARWCRHAVIASWQPPAANSVGRYVFRLTGAGE